MSFREPPQPVRPWEFQLVVRTYIPFETYLGFKGDNRSFSTSPSVTYRSSMFVVFDIVNGKITSPLVGNSTGTSRLNPTDAAMARGEFGAKGREFARLIHRPAPYFANVTVRLNKFQGDKGRILLEASIRAHDPYPVVEKLAPNIDTDTFFTAFLRDGNLFVAGSVIGDSFPSTEVFIRDHRDRPHPLLDFSTPYGATGTIRLMGIGTRKLGKFEEGIMLDDQGGIIGCVPWQS